MDIFLMEDLKELIQRRDGAMVSIYLPMYRVGVEVQQNRIRLKNTLNKAEEELLGIGKLRTEVEAILQPAVKLLHDDIFWNHQSDGLVLFLTDDWFCYYRLPETFEETLVVTDRFHIKPLIPYISNDLRFFLLTLSLDEVRLYQGDRYHLEKIDSDDFPEGMDEALRFDDPERELQFHTQTDSPVGTTARPAEFHGHGVSSENRKKDRIERYLQMVEQGVYKTIGDQSAPLLLAGGDYLLAMYRQVNKYSHLIEESIVGNVEARSPQEIHEEAIEVIEPILHKKRQEMASQYHALRDRDKASESLAAILPAAYQGRVKALFVAREREIWGNYDPESQKVKIYKEPDVGAEDLLDLALVQTFIYGGDIYVLPEEDVPGDGVLSAVFRF